MWTNARQNQSSNKERHGLKRKWRAGIYQVSERSIFSFFKIRVNHFLVSVLFLPETRTDQICGRSEHSSSNQWIFLLWNCGTVSPIRFTVWCTWWRASTNTREWMRMLQLHFQGVCTVVPAKFEFVFSSWFIDFLHCRDRKRSSNCFQLLEFCGVSKWTFSKMSHRYHGTLIPRQQTFPSKSFWRIGAKYHSHFILMRSQFIHNSKNCQPLLFNEQSFKLGMTTGSAAGGTNADDHTRFGGCCGKWIDVVCR